MEKDQCIKVLNELIWLVVVRYFTNHGWISLDRQSLCKILQIVAGYFKRKMPLIMSALISESRSKTPADF